MRWLSSRTCERFLKQKVGDVSSQPLQPGGRWRRDPTEGAETKTWRLLGFISTHLLSDCWTHAGQKTLPSLVLRRYVSHSAVLFWRDTGSSLSQAGSQPA